LISWPLSPSIIDWLYLISILHFVACMLYQIQTVWFFHERRCEIYIINIIFLSMPMMLGPTRIQIWLKWLS
jgi:hypothetical protein